MKIKQNFEQWCTQNKRLDLLKCYDLVKNCCI